MRAPPVRGLPTALPVELLSKHRRAYNAGALSVIRTLGARSPELSRPPAGTAPPPEALTNISVLLDPHRSDHPAALRPRVAAQERGAAGRRDHIPRGLGSLGSGTEVTATVGATTVAPGTSAPAGENLAMSVDAS